MARWRDKLSLKFCKILPAISTSNDHFLKSVFFVSQIIFIDNKGMTERCYSLKVDNKLTKRTS